MESSENTTQATYEELIKQKDAAYGERDHLVALLALLCPSWRTRHPDSDTDWDDDWRWIIGIKLPTGHQATWHIHDSELHLFEKVPVEDVKWDGHTTEDKYRRIRHAINWAVPSPFAGPQS